MHLFEEMVIKTGAALAPVEYEIFIASDARGSGYNLPIATVRRYAPRCAFYNLISNLRKSQSKILSDAHCSHMCV